MALTGKDAEDFTAELAARNAEIRAQALARAKADAELRGKEPFDLTRLETMADTSSEGRLDPEPERHVRFEEMYYVWFPKILTIEDFARKVEELNKW